jgi:hypothetical protein
MKMGAIKQEGFVFFVPVGRVRLLMGVCVYPKATMGNRMRTGTKSTVPQI